MQIRMPPSGPIIGEVPDDFTDLGVFALTDSEQAVATLDAAPTGYKMIIEVDALSDDGNYYRLMRPVPLGTSAFDLYIDVGTGADYDVLVRMQGNQLLAWVNTLTPHSARIRYRSLGLIQELP